MITTHIYTARLTNRLESSQNFDVFRNWDMSNMREYRKTKWDFKNWWSTVSLINEAPRYDSLNDLINLHWTHEIPQISNSSPSVVNLITKLLLDFLSLTNDDVIRRDNFEIISIFYWVNKEQKESTISTSHRLPPLQFKLAVETDDRENFHSCTKDEESCKLSIHLQIDSLKLFLLFL